MAVAAALLALPLAASSAPPGPAVCTLGRRIVADLADRMRSDSGQVYVAARRDDGTATLLSRCPRLLDMSPARLALTDEPARHRAADHGPGVRGPHATVFWIATPVFASDRRSATVTLTYDCSGLCGGEFEQRYRRTRDGWRADGDVHTKRVS